MLIGGGGVIVGIVVVYKVFRFEVCIIGVEMMCLLLMCESVEVGECFLLLFVYIIVDGIVVKCFGECMFEIVCCCVDEIVFVDEEEIVNVILLLFECEKIVVEGVGVMLLVVFYNGYVEVVCGKKMVMVLCGGNIDVNLFFCIIECGLIKDGCLICLCVIVFDCFGVFVGIFGEVVSVEVNVFEIYYYCVFLDFGFGEVDIELWFEMCGGDYVCEIVDCLVVMGCVVNVNVVFNVVWRLGF